jgi:hypothetical protein
VIEVVAEWGEITIETTEDAVEAHEEGEFVD